jgi:hypothetical protein
VSAPEAAARSSCYRGRSALRRRNRHLLIDAPGWDQELAGSNPAAPIGGLDGARASGRSAGGRKVRNQPAPVTDRTGGNRDATPSFPSSNGPARDSRAELEQRRRQALAHTGAVLEETAALFERHARVAAARGDDAAAAEDRRLAAQAREGAARVRAQLGS